MRIALLAGCLPGVLLSAPRAGAVGLQSVGTFNAPVFVTSPPGDPRLFVVERAGRIQVLHDGTVTQFLDIHTQTTTDGERGLLSMAFDPNYATNGLFYVFYTGTSAADGVTGLGHVDEFHVSSDPNVADPASQRHVLTISRPSSSASNHNGGQLQFGKDGDLYISVGDGGTGGSTAPDPTVLNGKILRIDPHGVGDGAHGIPPTNPFAGSATARQEIWSLGLRNPFRFSFDHLTGDLVIGDVGESSREEIDFAPASAGAEVAPITAGPPAKGSSAPVRERRRRSSTIRTPIPVETWPTAARSSAATSTGERRLRRSPAATSTRTSVPRSCARSSWDSRLPPATVPRARPGRWSARAHSARTPPATSTS